MQVLARLCAMAVGAVIAVAGAGKLMSWGRWREAARQQHVWNVVALVVPPLELVLGAWLIAFDPAPIPLGAATCLLLVFTAFLVAAVRAGSTVPCACFGTRAVRPPSSRDVMRNLALIALLVAAAAMSPS